VGQDKPSPEWQRKKGQPWVSRHGARQQWLHLTMWQEEGLGYYPQGYGKCQALKIENRTSKVVLISFNPQISLRTVLKILKARFKEFLV